MDSHGLMAAARNYPSCLRQVSAQGQDSEVSWLQYHPSGESTELALELYSLREGGLIRMLFITQCLRWASSTGGILLGPFLHCM